MDISIIIVSWNAKNHLRNCLSSLFAAPSHAEMEIIVVDNASTDGSPEMVERMFPSVVLKVNNENLGFAKANNIGIKIARGRFLFLINSDIQIIKGCLDSLLEFLEAHPRAGMAGPKVLNPDLSLQPSCKGFPTNWNSFCRALGLDRLFPSSSIFGTRLMTNWAHNASRQVEILSGCFLGIRKEAVEEVGGLDERFFMYGEDIDWCRRFIQAGWEVWFFPGAEAVHFGGASSANAPVRFYLEMQKANIQYFRKYHSIFSSVVFIAIVWFHQILRILAFGAAWAFSFGRRKEYRLKVDRSWASIKWLALRL